MKHSERFTNAVTKLYNAFHENRLNAMDCTACAVGNICDNSADWAWAGRFFDNSFFFADEDDIKQGHKIIQQSGYSVDELIRVERIFIQSTSFGSKETKESQFRGLCSVVEYLCELEGIPNVMDYSKLFETENDTPKHQLQEVFV